MRMFVIVASAAAMMVSSPLTGSAQAAGCVSGAAVGGVAGHIAGHGVLGAAAGCAVGHSRAKKQQREAQQAQARTTDAPAQR